MGQIKGMRECVPGVRRGIAMGQHLAAAGVEDSGAQVWVGTEEKGARGKDQIRGGAEAEAGAD